MTSNSLLERVEAYFRRELWRADLAHEPPWRAWPLHLVRCAAMAVERGLAHQLPIRASALTFVTVLSLVPSLAFAFSVAKSLGAYEQVRASVVEPFLEELFVTDDVERGGSSAESARAPVAAPDGGERALEERPEEAAQVAEESEQQLRVAIEKVLEFVEQTDVKRLGALGFLVVVYAVIRLLGGIEAALNQIWNVERPRRLVRKVADYVAIVVVGPLLAGFAATSTAVLGTSDNAALVFLRDDLGLGNVLVWLDFVLPVGTMWVVFTLLYMVMPNTKVRLRSALFGGFVAALLWTAVQELHVKSQVGVASYNALYAGFAAFPIFLLWLWLSWLVVLAGAEFGFADQHARAYRRQALADSGNQAWFEQNVLRALGRIVGAFQRGVHPPGVTSLVDELGVPESELESGLGRLERAGLLIRTGEGEDAAFALARSPESVSVHEALAMLRGLEDDGSAPLSDELDARLRAAYREAVLAGGAARSLAEVAADPAAPERGA